MSPLGPSGEAVHRGIAPHKDNCVPRCYETAGALSHWVMVYGHLCTRVYLPPKGSPFSKSGILVESVRT
jgi:hypothetical protein